ncbi:hypothetical protein BDDG_12612 [Blastomyces dermatitidis ATCC 18188]|uniref:Uncharacterized protein n=1 Tax=Ajellomyces dermatitidis (strain ATCC 18188 / CBS 674.68) TaxID=653446 RepID=A0A0J9EQ49_AJEDA|nr:hypothetical protein BDDG_12612 [Blastomyces dermatitidis ATCC 18188]
MCSLGMLQRARASEYYFNLPSSESQDSTTVQV